MITRFGPVPPGPARPLRRVRRSPQGAELGGGARPKGGVDLKPSGALRQTFGLVPPYLPLKILKLKTNTLSACHGGLGGALWVRSPPPSLRAGQRLRGARIQNKWVGPLICQKTSYISKKGIVGPKGGPRGEGLRSKWIGWTPCARPPPPLS